MQAEWYLQRLFVEDGPALVLALIGVSSSPVIGWMCAAEIAVLSLLAHKEERFLYPVIPLLLILMSQGCTRLVQKIHAMPETLYWKGTLVGCSVLLTSCLSLICWPNFNYRGARVEGMAVMAEVSREPEICGIELRGVPLFELGGYTYLHRQIPLFVGGDEHFIVSASAYNWIVSANGLDTSQQNQFALQACRGGICLYKRKGLCSGGAEPDVNTVLRETGG